MSPLTVPNCYLNPQALICFGVFYSIWIRNNVLFTQSGHNTVKSLREESVSTFSLRKKGENVRVRGLFFVGVTDDDKGPVLFRVIIYGESS